MIYEKFLLDGKTESQVADPFGNEESVDDGAGGEEPHSPQGREDAAEDTLSGWGVEGVHGNISIYGCMRDDCRAVIV